MTDWDTIDEDVFTPYTMTPGHGNTTGLCLVFNNIRFSVPQLMERTGSIADLHRIEKVFRCFGFKVEEKRDCTSVAMMDCLRRTAKSYSRDYCAFVCFFLSHGKEEKICDRDGRLVPLKELISMFVDYCPHMRGKPKLFFVQICRNGETESPASAGSQKGSEKTAAISIFPPEKDILLAFATTSGREAYRYGNCGSPWNRGSPYIEQLTKVLRVRGHQDSILKVLRITGKLVEEQVAVRDKDMCPSFTSTLTRSLTFSLLQGSPIQEANEREERVSYCTDLGLTLR